MQLGSAQIRKHQLVNTFHTYKTHPPTTLPVCDYATVLLLSPADERLQDDKRAGRLVRCQGLTCVKRSKLTSQNNMHFVNTGKETQGAT
jgi:hypothetical protein